MDELEFEEVFCKDSRNRRGTDNGKKRCNYKEVLKRSHQEAKREKQRCE